MTPQATPVRDDRTPVLNLHTTRRAILDGIAARVLPIVLRLDAVRRRAELRDLEASVGHYPTIGEVDWHDSTKTPCHSWRTRHYVYVQASSHDGPTIKLTFDANPHRPEVVFDPGLSRCEVGDRTDALATRIAVDSEIRRLEAAAAEAEHTLAEAERVADLGRAAMVEAIVGRRVES